MVDESRREQQRRILVADILSEARSQLEAGGPAGVSVRGISRAVGMSAPSLYTYFASLGELFTELIVQSLDSLAASIDEALKAVANESLENRLLAGPRAYRAWGVANPQHFNLVFFDQITGYEAPPDGLTVDAQVAVLRPIAAPYAEARGIELDALETPGDDTEEFLAWWGAFHGLVALEVNHHLDWVDPEAIFERRLAADVAHIIAD